jgi:hypothetical protein
MIAPDELPPWIRYLQGFLICLVCSAMGPDGKWFCYKPKTEQKARRFVRAHNRCSHWIEESH